MSDDVARATARTGTRRPPTTGGTPTHSDRDADETDFDPRGSAGPEEDGRFGLRIGGERLRVVFTLLASRRGR